VARENLSAAGPPLATERERLAPLWAALPTLKRAPSKIIVKQGYHGHSDVGGWLDAATALVGFGASALPAYPTTDMAEVFKLAGVIATGMPGELRPTYDMMYHSAVFDFAKVCSGDAYLEDVGHCWGRTDEEQAQNLERWADALVKPMRAAGFSKLTQFALHDELDWDLPMIWSGKNNITDNPRVFRRYHQYLRDMSGLADSRDFGATSWAGVVPITRANITAGAANEKQLLVRFYWTIRFGVWDVETFFAQATLALVESNGGEPFTIYTNWNNFHGRLYTPGGEWNVNCSMYPQRCQSDTGSMDWFEAGRLRSGTMLWTGPCSHILILSDRPH
jgi:hypothetical protein